MTQETYKYCIRALATDVGRKRSANEDNLGERVTTNGLVTVVCDGMGGHVGGAEASRIAVSSILDFLTDQYFDDPRQAISEAIYAANSAILQQQAAVPALAGMGSTCVMIIVRDGKVYYGWVGDSRIYLVRHNSITQLSKDQSVVQGLVDAGIITAAEAEHHARKNEITNCLGIPTMTEPQVCARPIIPSAGDTFLLCSDGLSGMVSDGDIAAIISDRQGMRLNQRAATLIDSANNNGGLDNITALLLEFPAGVPGANREVPGQQYPAATDNRHETGNIASAAHSTTAQTPSGQKSPWLMKGIIIGATALVLTGGAIFLALRKSTDKDERSSTASTETVSTNAVDASKAPVVSVATISVTAQMKSGDTTEPVLLFTPMTGNPKNMTVQYSNGNAMMTLDGKLTADFVSVDSDKFVVVKDTKKPDVFGIYPKSKLNFGNGEAPVLPEPFKVEIITGPATGDGPAPAITLLVKVVPGSES